MSILSYIRILGAALIILTPATALADCSDIGSEQWNELSAKMGQAYEQADYNTALDYGKQLLFICDKAPISNYLLSETYRQLGRDEEALSAVRRATDYLHEYDVPQNLIEKIWLRRAELELPYKKQAEALKVQLDEKQAELDALDKAYKERIETMAVDGSSAVNSAVTDARITAIENLYTLQWTGTGFAAGGALFTLVGASLVGIYYNNASDDYKKLLSGKNNHFNKYNSYEKVGYGFLAAGIGLGVAGSITAIVAHAKIVNAEKKLQTAVKLNITPSYMGVTLNF